MTLFIFCQANQQFDTPKNSYGKKPLGMQVKYGKIIYETNTGSSGLIEIWNSEREKLILEQNGDSWPAA